MTKKYDFGLNESESDMQNEPFQIKEKSSAEIIGILMESYNHFRGLWIEKFGNDDNFDSWFTDQVKGKK